MDISLLDCKYFFYISFLNTIFCNIFYNEKFFTFIISICFKIFKVLKLKLTFLFYK